MYPVNYHTAISVQRQRRQVAAERRRTSEASRRQPVRLRRRLATVPVTGRPIPAITARTAPAE